MLGDEATAQETPAPIYGAVAQLREHLAGSQKVGGWIPPRSTKSMRVTGRSGTEEILVAVHTS